MPIQTFAPAAQRQQFGQSFTPQIDQSRIIQALLSQGQQQIETPAEGVGQVAQQLAGAFATKKEKDRRKKEQEDFQDRIAELLAPSTLLPGAAGLGAVTSQNLPPPGTDPNDPAGLNREAVAREQELFRSRFR